MTFMNEIFAEKVEETTEAQTGALTLEAELDIVDGAEAQYQLAEAELATYERAHDEMVSISREAEEAIADNAMTPVLFKQINARLRYVTEGGLGQSKELTTEAELDAAITLTQEGVMEGIKKVWEGIKKVAAKVWNSFSDLIAKIFGGVKKLRENMEATLKVVEGSSGDFKDAIATKNGLDRLHVNGEFSVKGLTEGLKFTKTMRDATAESAINSYKLLAEVALKDSSDELPAKLEESIVSVNKRAQQWVGKSLPGGKTVADISKKTQDDSGVINVPSVRIIDDKNATLKDDDVRLTKKDIIDILKVGIAAAKDMESNNYKKDFEEGRKKATKAADDLTDSFEKGKLAKTWTKVGMNLIYRLNKRSYVSTYQKMVGYEFSVIRGINSFAAAAATELKTGDK